MRCSRAIQQIIYIIKNFHEVIYNYALRKIQLYRLRNYNYYYGVVQQGFDLFPVQKSITFAV
jgi:hypothetical protein